MNHPLRARGAQALVEFAISFPILIVMLVAFLDFGYLLFVKNTLAHAAREGLSRAEAQPFDAAATRRAVLAHAIGVRLPPENVTVSSTASPATTGTIPMVTVTVQYTHDFFVPWWHKGPVPFQFTLKGHASPAREEVPR